MNYRSSALVLVIVGIAASVAACDSPSSAPAAETSPLEASAAEARKAGVDEAQLAILESGSVSFEDYELAMNRAYDCMRSAGVEVDVRGVQKYHGVTLVDATTQAGEDVDGIVEDCYERHARYVDAYWQVSSPDAIAYAERRAAALKPLLQDCLSGRGIDWPADASFNELSGLAFGPGQQPDEPNCLDDIGYTEWDG